MTSENKPFVRPCGCTHRGMGYVWDRCPKHAHEASTERALEGLFGIPQCPEGCGDVRRPKCAWEAADCPRQEVKHQWEKLVKAAVAYTTLFQEGE